MDPTKDLKEDERLSLTATSAIGMDPTKDVKEDERLLLTAISAIGDKDGATYGSTAKADDGFQRTLDEWGGARKLFLNSWLALAPIFAPLYLVTLANLGKEKYTCSCDHHFEQFTFMRGVCVVSFLGVSNVATVCRLTALALVSWRFIRQRLFYVCLKKRILLDLSRSSSIGRAAMATNVTLFLLACVHMLVALAYGSARPAEKVLGFHRKAIAPDQLLLATKISTLLVHPAMLGEPENAQGLAFLTAFCITFIGPAAIGIGFLREVDDAKACLVPFSTMYEDSPDSVHQAMGESIVVSEAIAQQVLEGDVMCAAECGESPTEVDANDQDQAAWKKFRNEALEFDKVTWILRGNEKYHDVVHAMASRKSGNETPPLLCPQAWKNRRMTPATLSLPGLLEAFNKPWWPLDMILKPDMTEEDPFEFRHVYWVHSILCFVFILSELFFRLDLQFHFLKAEEGERTVKASVDMQVAFHILSVPIEVGLASALFACAKKIYSLWPKSS